MQLRLNFLLWLFFIGHLATAQITTQPALPVETQKVVLAFNSAEESRLGYSTGDLYAHTGVITEGNPAWQHVIGNWDENSTQPKLTHKGDGIYELAIEPSIREFYNVGAGEKVVKMAFVFRTADRSKQTNDLFVSVYQDGLVVEITSPANGAIIAKNQNIDIAATSSEQASLKLFGNGTLLAETNGTNITTSKSFGESGENWLVAEATTNSETKRDSVKIFVRNDVVEAVKPAQYKKGINYLSDSKVALVLWAPLKDFVFVLGDFNNWEPSNNYLMKKDGDYFWLEIENLEAGTEYAFQYLIDGEILVADPYTEKILDPWNDQYIPASVYPGLKPYPENKTEGIVSVLQTAQPGYNWEVNNFEAPETGKLVIYELLVRDFTTEHTFKTVREELDYLEDLRVNVLELMPVNEFEGNSSWGYNPAFYFSPDKFYGPKNELKKLIDECHKRGIAVVIDMVLNHSYGQSPFVQMYMDNWEILPENPWYNVTSPNQVFQWGYDFNHEAKAVEELVDSVNAFWMSEYKIDGFRFDFTKGFTNTPGDGGAYDAARIKILKRMASEIWERNDDAIVIFEHLADNSEETELADHGILLWGNMHGEGRGNYLQAARGNIAASDLSWGIYAERGWNEPNLIAYPESHDEERIMYDLKRTGLSDGEYNIRNQKTALDRIELNSVFYLPLPGPKMIWQFGERGYDLSINRCEDGAINNDCRTSPKPPYWQYLNNTDRTDLFHVMAKLNELKQSYPEFTPETFSYDLGGATKWYKLNSGDNHVLAIGNFGLTENTIDITFQKTAKWYAFFSRDSLQVSAVEQNMVLAPGEYRLYSTRKFDEPNVTTDLEKVENNRQRLQVFPNPTNGELNISSSSTISQIEIYSLTGKLLMAKHRSSGREQILNVGHFQPGVYLLRVIHGGRVETSKFVIQ